LATTDFVGGGAPVDAIRRFKEVLDEVVDLTDIMNFGKLLELEENI
jgi:hypothetical protein